MAPKKDNRPPQWWEAKPFLMLPLAYLSHLQRSDLTGREFRVLTVVLQETIGASGEQWGTFGRKANTISAGTIAKRTGLRRSNVHVVVESLASKGWVSVTPGRGKRANRITPLPEPERQERPDPVSADDAEPVDPTAIGDYLARKRAERDNANLKRALGEESS